MTFSPAENLNHGVLYGCTEETRDLLVRRLSLCDFGVYHPLTLPTLFAEIERNRLFRLVEDLLDNMIGTIVNISNNVHANGPRAEEGEKKNRPQISKNVDSMQDWLDINWLKNGLENWSQQLVEMIQHVDELNRADFYTDYDEQSLSTQTTPVNTKIVLPEKLDGPPSEFDNVKSLKISGIRIKERLKQIKLEYDAKIRECTTVIDGMTLATQMVSSDDSGVKTISWVRVGLIRSLVGMEQDRPGGYTDESGDS